MHVREHAQRTVRADQPRRRALDIVEIRPPDQRAVAENPQVFAQVFDGQLHQSMIPKSGYRFSEKIMLHQWQELRR